MAKEKVKVTPSAKVDDMVIFMRKEIEIIAKVLELRENTAMVEITDDTVCRQLDLQNSITVVNHKNYKVYNN